MRSVGFRLSRAIMRRAVGQVWWASPGPLRGSLSMTTVKPSEKAGRPRNLLSTWPRRRSWATLGYLPSLSEPWIPSHESVVLSRDRLEAEAQRRHPLAQWLLPVSRLHCHETLADTEASSPARPLSCRVKSGDVRGRRGPAPCCLAASQTLGKRQERDLGL